MPKSLREVIKGKHCGLLAFCTKICRFTSQIKFRLLFWNSCFRRWTIYPTAQIWHQLTNWWFSVQSFEEIFVWMSIFKFQHS